MLVSPDRVRLAARAAATAALAGFTILLIAGTDVASSAAGTAAAVPNRPTVHVSADGSDARSCRSRAESCASFQRAYGVARPGEIVEVAAGSYPSQSLRGGSDTSGGPNVVFRPAPGARVVLGGLSFAGAKRVTVRGMHTSYKGSAPGARNQEGIFVGPQSRHIRLERMDAGSIHTWFADHVTVLGGDYGPCDAIWGAENVCGNSKFDVSTNVTVDGALFHDYRFDATCFTVGGADCHWECMYVNGGENIAIRNSKFRDCAIFDIFMTISGPDAAKTGHRNVTIENNWFDTPWSEDASGGSPSMAYGLALAWCGNSSHGYRDIRIRFNSFQRNATIMLDDNKNCTFDNVQVVGNLMMWTGCDSRFTYAYNVWSTAWRTGKCGATDRIIGNRFPYVNAHNGRVFNFRLSNGRRTIVDNLVPASVVGGCAARDIDHDRRPLNKRCDAGADERR